MIVALTNAKGGVGKTTLAVHLAAWLSLYRIRVAFFDCDAQRLSSFWLKTALPDMDVHVVDEAEVIDRELPSVAREYEAVVVDAPGGLGEVTGAILSHADAALIPTGTSGLDWEGLHWTTATIKEIQKVRNELPEGVLSDEMEGSAHEKFLLPNAAIIPVMAEAGQVALAELRDFSQVMLFGMTGRTLPYRQRHKHITPKRYHIPGKPDRPGRLMWQMGKSKQVREASLDIDGVFQEVFPEIAEQDPQLVRRLVTPRRKWIESGKEDHGVKRAANS